MLDVLGLGLISLISSSSCSLSNESSDTVGRQRRRDLLRPREVLVVRVEALSLRFLDRGESSGTGGGGGCLW